MKNLIIFVVVAVVFFFAGRWAWEEFGGRVSADDATRRVEAAVAGMQENGDEQTAASMFMDGVVAIPDQGRLTAAWDRWTAWRREKGLNQAIRSFEVGEVDTVGDHPVVAVTIDGRTHRVAAPADEPLRWAD